MQYREFGRTGVLVSAVGFGANRFRQEDLSFGIEHCAEIVVQAANAGVNFFDSAVPYSNGNCESILKLAFNQIKGRKFVCGKSNSSAEKTSDSVLRYIERSLENLGIDCFDFYYMWSVRSLAQYQQIMAPHGPYKGAQLAKDRGLIKHICFSSHAVVDDAKKIIEDGAFEGVLLSYSLLNYRQHDILLQSAAKQGMGVAVMNPLGGGIIPENPQLFEYAMLDKDSSLAESALRFIYAHPEISTILCGISTAGQLEADVEALAFVDNDVNERITKVTSYSSDYGGLCTGCGYCDNCPVGLPIPTLMSAYNMTKFNITSTDYNRNVLDLIQDIELFRKLDGQMIFETGDNPCLQCGKCEAVCTQLLPIVASIADIYDKSIKRCVPLSIKRGRLVSLQNCGFQRIGFYTARIVTAGIIDLYRSFFGDFMFEVFVFDQDPSLWGKTYCGVIIRPPSDIPLVNLDVCIITNYKNIEDIYRELTALYTNVTFRKLYEDGDVPWVY